MNLKKIRDFNPLKYVFIGLIRLYRLLLSPVIGNGCIYTPTCSAYGLEAVREFGAAKGGWLTLRRILRCVPWKSGGRDPVPYNLEGDMKWLF
jgi:putative membrane protein insertion efficiency factor